MTRTTISTAEETARVGALRDVLDGEVVLPGDPDWDAARQAWNLSVDQRPAAVVFAESAEDIVAVVDYARRDGMRVTTQGTGHFADTLESFDNTILIRTCRMRGLEIDPETRTARAEAGVLWEEVSLAAAEYGLAGLGRLLAGRRRRRLHARRWARLARAPLRPGREQRHRRRARDRRREPRPRRPRQRARALPGHPRRRRQLRHRHRDRVHALPGPGGLRRRPLLPR